MVVLSTQLIIPAHDFVCEKYSTHFGILVLAFVDDGLKEENWILIPIPSASDSLYTKEDRSIHYSSVPTLVRKR